MCIINCGPLCPFTDTSLCRLGRYRLQIWEEPLRKCKFCWQRDLDSRAAESGQFNVLPRTTLHNYQERERERDRLPSSRLVRGHRPEPKKKRHVQLICSEVPSPSPLFPPSSPSNTAAAASAAAWRQQQKRCPKQKSKHKLNES